MHPPPDFLAVKMSHLALASKRLGKVRGIRSSSPEDDDEDAAEKTGADPEDSSAGTICVIPIRGCLARDCKGWFPWLTDTEEIEDLLREAENDANVSAIVLDIDSPGGTVNGSTELAEAVARFTKPIVSYTAGMCDSAAYKVAAGSKRILARKTASIGSIGTLLANVDIAEMYALMGVSVELFTSGEYKGAGYPGTSLSEAQRALFKKTVLDLGLKFQTHVLNYRPLVPFEAMQGQDFFAEEALASGLIDGIALNINEAIQAAQDLS